MNPADRPRSVLLLFACALILGAGCTNAPTTKDDLATEAQTGPVRPGAERWQGHALLLPADSPVVFWTESDGLFESLGGLRDWIFEEPSMFGPNGERMIAQGKTEWSAVITHLGMDPLAPQSWQEMGLETEKELYVGLYPVRREQASGFVTAFDKAFRKGLDLDEETELLIALDTMAIFGRNELPQGLHSQVASAVADHEPLLGARAVVPVADREAFWENIQKLMRGAGYSHKDEGEEGRRSVHFFYNLEADFPGVLLRLGEETAIFDIVTRRSDNKRAQSRDEEFEVAVLKLRMRLGMAVESYVSGRPAAPKPADKPILGASVDQQGAARLAKLRGYRIALERARTQAVGQRDAVFLQDVHSTLKSARNWSIASEKLSGTSYGLFTGTEPDSYFRANVTFFGAREASKLAVSSAPRSLQVEGRGMGLSLDLLPMSDPVWQSFIGVNHASEILDNFTAADYDPSLFALSFPRSLTVLFANAEKVFEEDVVDSLQPMLEGSEAFRRLEVASAGVNMRGLRIRPRLVGLVLLDAEASAKTQARLAEVVGRGLRAMVEEVDEAQEDGESVEESQELEESEESQASFEAAKLLELEGQDGPLFYYVGTDDEDAPYLFFSYGLDREASRGELDGLSVAPGDESEASLPRTFFARAEPVALFSLITLFDPDLFEPLDISILTQRLGALTFTVEPKVVDGVQTIGYDFALQKPPSLD